MIANLVGGFLVIMIGVNLAPTVANVVASAVNPTKNASGGDVASNVTGAAVTMLNLTTLFYCLSVASIGIGIATVGLKNSGLL
jgi:hypothetical protein